MTTLVTAALSDARASQVLTCLFGLLNCLNPLAGPGRPPQLGDGDMGLYASRQKKRSDKFF